METEILLFFLYLQFSHKGSDMLETTIQSLSLLAQTSGDSVGGAGGAIFACVFGLIGLAVFIFWLWMLIDCLTRSFEGSEKIVWALVIIFLGIIGALVYFFVGRGRGTKA